MEQNERHDPRPSNDSRARQSVVTNEARLEESTPTRGQRSENFRPTMAMLIWAIIASIALTMLIGFTWGGWVTGGSSLQAGETVSKDAVVQRLAPICVAQFEQDPDRDVKLGELKELSTSRRTQYVQEQGWGTMPGEENPDRNVADACAKLIVAAYP